MYPTPTIGSDQELRRRLVNALHSRGPHDELELQIEATGGVVVLRGRYSTDSSKRLCLECCRHVPGVLRLVDQLEVQPKSMGRG